MVIVVSAHGHVPEEGIRIAQLFEAGLDLFHLRKPKSTIEEVAMLLDDIPDGYHERIAFHQHHNWALSQGFRRLHFPSYLRNKLTQVNYSELKRNNYKISTSIHEEALIDHLNPTFSYSFLGPVFPSISKPGYTPKANLISEKLPASPIQLIALGGIKASNVRQVQAAGFDGVALLGSVWSFPALEGLAHFKECLQIVQNSSK